MLRILSGLYVPIEIVFFGDIKNGEIHYSEIGELAIHQLESANELKKNVILPNYVVMPNRIHLIVELKKRE